MSRLTGTIVQVKDTKLKKSSLDIQSRRIQIQIFLKKNIFAVVTI